MLITAVGVLSLSGCNEAASTEGPPLQEAWKKKDRDFFIAYLDSLGQVPFNDFIYDVYDLANASNFVYGLLDTDCNWSAIDKDSIVRTQLDIIRINKYFFKHCSFEVNIQYIPGRSSTL
ncbi:MAG: hypothetical protein JWO09_2734 [Bacteroidetes bacterium]|nr:hypothetical protein [Bacteroidota bacterium]